MASVTFDWTAYAPSREAEPRFGTVIAELGSTKFDNLESRFDGESDLTRGALRRTHFPRPAFSRADEA